MGWISRWTFLSYRADFTLLGSGSESNRTIDALQSMKNENAVILLVGEVFSSDKKIQHSGRITHVQSRFAFCIGTSKIIEIFALKVDEI